MTLFNSDGSRAEMSGNGIRCFAQALAARRGNLDPQLILTDAGERLVTIEAAPSATTRSSPASTWAPSSRSPNPTAGTTLGCHPDRPVVHLSLGNPHSVVGVDDVDVVDLLSLGQKVPHVNLEIVEPGEHQDEIRMRVHERGAGITEACGTGACASAFAAARWGLATPRDGKLVVRDGWRPCDSGARQPGTRTRHADRAGNPGGHGHGDVVTGARPLDDTSVDTPRDTPLRTPPPASRPTRRRSAAP